MASGEDSLTSTLAGAHDFVYDYLCSLCALKDKEKEAVGYCVDCEDYLCAECFRYHRTPRPCRDHHLLDQTQMPKRPDCDVCMLDQKIIDAAGYCVTCGDYLCSDCYKYHLGPKPMRHHTLLDQTRMPLKKPSRDSTRQHVTRSLPARDTRADPQQQQQPDETRKSRAVHIRDIRLTGQHETNPWITGCVAMASNRLVLVDNNNSTIIILGLADSTAQTRMTLPSKPWDITLVNYSQLAVTCPNAQTIALVKVGDMLQLDREVKVKGECHGIACINDSLVVSYYNPRKVEILSVSGNVLHTVVTEDQGERLFTYPFYIELSRDHASTCIYISDRGRNKVTRLSLAGQVLATFQNDKLVNHPRGLAVDKAGSVYVCGVVSHNVVQLAADLTQPRQLLERSDGVEYSYSVCYCQATDQLYVGMDYSDVVKGFQLK